MSSAIVNDFPLKLLPRERSSDAIGCTLTFGGGGGIMMPLGCCPIFDDISRGERSKETIRAYFFVVIVSVDTHARGWMLSYLLMVVNFPSSEVGCSISHFVRQR